MRRILVIIWAMVVVTSCGGGGGGGGQTDWGPEITGPLFTVSPLDLANIQFVTGQGHMAPFPHTLPTPHVYLYWNFGVVAPPLIPVVAPGPGRITFVLKQDLGGGINDTKIMVRASPTLTWYLDHISLASGFGVGSVLAPGMAIGTTSPLSGAIDLGLLDSTVEHPFIAPERYGASLVTAISPWPRFTDVLRDYFYSISSVVGPDKNGAVCFDVDGTAAGNWFLEGVPDSAEAYGDPANWHKQLAFARDETDPQRWRISVGGTISAPSLWAIAVGDPEPTAIATGQGIRIIRLYSSLSEDGTMLPTGWLLVRMDYSGVMTVEYFSAADHPPASAVDTPVTTFSGAESVYRRYQSSNG